MRVFIAGGTGVLGRASIPALLEAGHRVRSSARGNENPISFGRWGSNRSMLICTIQKPCAERLQARTRCSG